MTTIGLHQIYYKHNQLKGIDPEMIPYDNSALCRVFTELENEREYRVFKDNYEAKTHLDYDYTGFLSWKFKRKTNMTGERLKQIITNDKAKHDVYYVPHGPNVTSVWKHGNRHHKRLIDITQHVFDQLGYDIQLNTMFHTIDKCSFCNFWVGNKTFWDAYMDFTKPVYNFLTSSENNLPDDLMAIYLSQADKNIKSNYFAFIMERMFTTLLVVNNTITYRRVR